MEKVNIICMKWGTKFGPDYVNRLYKMVEKNITIPHRFICFTDDAQDIDPRVEIRPLPDLKPVGTKERGWRKLGLFAENLGDVVGQALFLDLDVIIRQNIDDFFKPKGEFFIIKDWDFPRDIIGNSSVFRFTIGKHPEIIEHFYQEGETISKRYRNEQAFLSYEMYRKGILQYWDKSWCVSFKRNCLRPWPFCYFKAPKDPETAKILVFHGHPNPIEAYHGFVGKMGFRYIKPAKWLDKYWER